MKVQFRDITKRFGRSTGGSVRVLPDKPRGRTITMYDTALSRAAYGQWKGPKFTGGVGTVEVLKRKRNGIPVALYDTALAQSAYGQPQLLGDLFNDIMGTVVPGWDARPDWMKKIQVKPDPRKLLETAVKVAPPQTVGKIVDQANQAGFNLFYRTPAGSVPVSGSMAKGMYSGYATFARATENIPTWVYYAGGGLLLLVLAQGMKK